MSRYRPNTTVAVIIENQGKLLFVEEAPEGRPALNQPAGHIEQGESLAQAAVREALEETGHKVELTSYLGLYTYTAPSNGTTYHRHCFIADSVSYDPEYDLDRAITGTHWLTLDELKKSGQARSPLVIKCAEDYLAGKCYPLELIYEHPNEQ